MSEAERWAAQGVFWEAVAGTCAGHSAVFCYNLMNEPLSPAGKLQNSGGCDDFMVFQTVSISDTARLRRQAD